MSRPRTVALVEAMGLVWSLGLAYLTAAYFVCYLCGFSVVLCTGLAAMCGCALTVGTLVLTRMDYRSPYAPGGSTAMGLTAARIHRCALGTAALSVGVMCWMAVRSPLAGWDGWSVWAFKAQAFATGGLPPAYFRDVLTLHTHPDYPLNLPIAESLLIHLPGSLADPLVTLIGPACVVALLCLIYTGLDRLYGRVPAAVGVAILATMPVVLYNAPAAGADVPLALYCGGAAIYLQRWWTDHLRRDAVLAGLLAGAAAWTKKEGLAIAVVTLSTYAAVELMQSARRRRAPALVPLLAACLIPLPWLVFVQPRHPLPRDFSPVTLGALTTHAERMPHVAALVLQQMLTWENWGPFWLILGAALAARARHVWRDGRLLLLLAGQIALYTVVFVFSNWQPYVPHAQGTLDRLLLQALPTAVILLVSLLGKRGSAQTDGVAVIAEEPSRAAAQAA
jgi:hypothetical protein